MEPSSASSRSMRLSAARSAFLAPKALAISRGLTLPLRSRIKAINSSREGRRFICHALTTSGGILGRRRVASKLFGSLRCLASLECGFGFGCRRFGSSGLCGGPLAGASGAPRGALGFARPCVWRRTPVGAGVDQSNGLFERNCLRRLVRRQRRIDAVMADIRPIAALLRHDRTATCRMVTERTARISAEALARTLGLLLGDQRHCVIEADGENVLGRFQIRVNLAVLHVRPVAADASLDRLAVLGM